jgi:hypothetical protein
MQIGTMSPASSSQQSRRRPGRPARPMSTFERRPVIDGTH